MIHTTTTVRILDTLPAGMTVDSDPRVIDGEVIIPRPGKPWLAIRPSPDCLACRGTGTIGEFVTDPGKKPVRVERPCGCCWKAASEFEYQEARGGFAVRAASFQRAETALDRARRRVERIRSELGRAETDAANIERAREDKIRPFIAAVATAEAAASESVAHAHSTHAMVDRTRAAADEAERQMAEAKDTLQQALVTYEQALNLAEAAATRLEPLAKAVEQAKDALRLATNTGGSRHHAEVAAKRIADLKTRLRCAEEDAAQLEPPPETKVVQEPGGAP